LYALAAPLITVDELLIQQSTILRYADPGKWDLEHVQHFLQLPENGDLALEGADSTIWGSVKDPKSYKPDLVALRPRAREDPFSRWAAENTITNIFTCGCARFIRPSRRHGVITYKDSTIYKITYWITVILAALIPVTSIAVLNEVQPMSSRLGTIAAFNVLISVCLIGFADAKRDQVFAINAAYVFTPSKSSPPFTIANSDQLCCGASGLRRPGQLSRAIMKKASMWIVCLNG
jgi:hypothetical protein